MDSSLKRYRARGLASIVPVWLCVLSGSTDVLAGDAQQIYRCVDRHGAVSLQDQPCPPDSAQQTRQVQTSGDSVAPTAVPTTPEPAAPKPSEPIQSPPGVSQAPMPEAWRCLDLEGRWRWSDADDPQGRWVPAWVVGLDQSLSPARPNAIGRRAPPPAQRPPGVTTNNGSADLGPMVWVEDRCWLLPPDERCRAWREQADAAERLRYNRTGTEARSAAAERDRLRARLDTYCR